MLYDLTIVGGGPAGLYAAFYAGLRDLKTKIVEADVELGGRLRYYPEKLVWDVGGLPPTPGERLRANLEAQARTFDPEVVTGQRVASMDRGADGHWVLTSDTGEVHHSRAVLLAVGYGTLGTRRLDLPGTAWFEGVSVLYSLRDPEEFRGLSLVVSGGGNSAVDWALQLAGVASSVTLVHRRREFRAHERTVGRLEEAGVRVWVPAAVTSLEGRGSQLTALGLMDLESGRYHRLDADRLLVGHGMEFEAAAEGSWDLTQPGIFRAGDCVQRPGKAGLIAGTFPEAIEAVNAAKLYLDPQAEAQAMVSSHNRRLDQKNQALGWEPVIS